MAWSGFFSGTMNVARITMLILVKIILLTLNIVFSITRFAFFIVVAMLTLGRFGMSTMDLGGKRR